MIFGLGSMAQGCPKWLGLVGNRQSLDSIGRSLCGESWVSIGILEPLSSSEWIDAFLRA